MSEFLNILKTLFLLIFFGNPITLTPSPVDMEAGSRLVFNLEKSARVIGGAYLSIDVTSMRPDYVDSWEAAEAWDDEVFGESRISASLINTSTGEEAKVDHPSILSYNDTTSRLIVKKDGGLERGQTYNKIVVETDVELRGVTMTWNSWSM